MNLAAALSTLALADPRYPDCWEVPPGLVDLEVAQHPISNPLTWLRRLVHENSFEALKLTSRTRIARRFLVRLVDILPIGICK